MNSFFLGRLRVASITSASMVLLALAAFGSCQKSPTVQQQETRRAPSAQVLSSANSSSGQRRNGGLDLTLLIAGDTHFGHQTPHDESRNPAKEPVGIEAFLLSMVQQMNDIPGQSWPVSQWGSVKSPSGVLVVGDLTESGDDLSWRHFQQFFGLTGKDGLVRYPVYELTGNHDYVRGWAIHTAVQKRHGSYPYAVDFGDLHVVCLGMRADTFERDWLRDDLARIGHERPVLLAMHYPLLGPYSDDDSEAANRRTQLASVLRGKNIIAIVHGHFHASGHYKWEDIDVIRVGSMKSDWKSFVALQVTDYEVRIGAWNVQSRSFWWWFGKPIHGASGKAFEGARVLGEAYPKLWN